MSMIMMMFGMAMGADLLDRDLGWTVVNDTVMGGVSSSRAAESGDRLRFTGEVSLENNGGFASVRSRPGELELSNVVGFRVALTGDGNTYDFTVRRRDLPMRGGSYRAPIRTTGEPQVLELPLGVFDATAFGRPVPAAPPLVGAGAAIESVGFLIGGGQSGAFSLEVTSIEPLFDEGGAYDAVARSALSRELASAIAYGVPAFNDGNPAHCRDVYSTVLRTALSVAPQAMTADERAVVQQAVTQSLGESATEAAWTLRRAMDALIAGA